MPRRVPPVSPRTIITYRRGAGPVPAGGGPDLGPLSGRGGGVEALSPPSREGFSKLSAPRDQQDIDSGIALQRGLVARPERVPGDGPIVGRLDKHVRVAGPPYLQLIGVQNQRCRALDGHAKQACPRSAPAR